MAKIIKKSNHLREEYNKAKSASMLGFLASAIGFILFAVLAVGAHMFSVAIPLMFVFGGGGLIGSMFKQKADALASGLQGEAATAEIFTALPATEYCGFQNITISFDGKQSELDTVIVGPKGVFIIETKNMGGTIVGNYDNPQWVQKKVGQQGTPYSKNFYSPIKQVGTHTYRLAGFLRENGINVHVNNMVYFSNPDAVIQLLGDRANTPVYSALANSSSELLMEILDRDDCIDEPTLIKIINLLNAIPAK